MKKIAWKSLIHEDILPWKCIKALLETPWQSIPFENRAKRRYCLHYVCPKSNRLNATSAGKLRAVLCHDSYHASSCRVPDLLLINDPTEPIPRKPASFIVVTIWRHRESTCIFASLNRIVSFNTYLTFNTLIIFPPALSGKPYFCISCRYY